MTQTQTWTPIWSPLWREWETTATTFGNATIPINTRFLRNIQRAAEFVQAQATLIESARRTGASLPPDTPWALLDFSKPEIFNTALHETFQLYEQADIQRLGAFDATKFCHCQHCLHEISLTSCVSALLQVCGAAICALLACAGCSARVRTGRGGTK